MRSDKRLLVICAACAALFLPPPLHAQGSDNIAWGLSLGAALPSSPLDDVLKTGFSGSGMIAFGTVESAFGFRLDVLYNRFGPRTAGSVQDAPAQDGLEAEGNEDTKIIGLTGSVIYPVLGEGRRLYTVAGLGGYGYRPGVRGHTRADDFGYNLGLGLWLAPLNGFVEARYHHVYRVLPEKKAARFVPISVGVLF